MPNRKLDTTKLPLHLSKKQKLSSEQREQIRKEYNEGYTSMRKLAYKYNVSKRSIQFCVYPERYENAKKRRREAWAEGKYREYYTKEKQRKAIADMRKRKRKFLNL